MIKPLGFHLEPTNICTLKCPGCARTRFIRQWPQRWQNHSIDTDQLLKFLDIDINGVAFLLNGNYGDPIYHPDFLDLISGLKLRGANLHITTNGSYQKPEWWSQLTSLLSKDDTVEFSVDGLPENFTQYRINADWQSIKIGMEICANSQCHTIWKFIPFSYNQHDIEIAKSLSQTMGIKEFYLKLSDRFDNDTEYLIPDPDLIRDRYQSMIAWKQTKESRGIMPKCETGQQHFISADGYYSPCCWMNDYRFYYKSQFGKNKDQYSISNTTISELLARSDMVDFFDRLPEQPGCQYNCPKIS